MEGGEGSAVEGDDGSDRCSRLVDLRLSVELGPSWMKLPHRLHHVAGDLAFFLELGEDSVEFIVYGHSRIFLHLGVATCGLNMIVDLVDVLLVAEDDDGVSFVGREIS